MCAARHIAYILAGSILDAVAVARYAFIYHFNAYQPAGDAFGLLLFYDFPARKVFCELGDPAQTCLQWRGSVVNIVTVKGKAFLKAQRVAGGKAYWLEALRRAYAEDFIPDRSALSPLSSK